MQNSVLVFAPHNDDEILGVGGTIYKLSNQGYSIVICEVTAGPSFQTLQEEAEKAHSILGVSRSIFLQLPSCGLESYSKTDMNERFTGIMQEIKPVTVFIPHYGDMHLDHRWVAEAAMVAVRPLHAPFVKKVLAYETLSETEWNTPSANNAFIPNVWIDISEEIDKKIAAMECFKSQVQLFPHPRSLEAIRALGQYRGSTIGARSAEAFMLVREIG